MELGGVALGGAERRAVEEVLDAGWLSMGPRVAALEEAFARAHGVEHAVAVSSGTAALHLALIAAGVGPGDEVVQPAINFVAAASMTRGLGARPVFADIESPQRPVLDPEAAGAAITPYARVLMVLHYGGYPARIAALRDLARRRGLALIEDACHAPGIRLDGRSLGAWGDAGCFSFFANKNLTTAEGGMLVTSRRELAERARMLRSHGMTAPTWDRHRGHARGYDVLECGFNYRMDEVRAALGLAQLRRLEDLNARRRMLTEAYRAALADMEDVEVVFGGYHGPHAGHLLAVVVPAELHESVRSACARARVQTSLHYPCITGFTAFRDCAAELPRSLEFARRALTLPLHPGMDEGDVACVCDAVRAACGVRC